MRVALTSTGSGLEAEPSGSFGRCPYFLIFDTEGEGFEAVRNPAENASGGAGVQAAQLLVDRKVAAVLTGRVGPHAMDVLRAAGIAIHDIGERDAPSALEDFRAGVLSRIETASAPRGRRGR
jgi:predicted Fe-Mo cluster-binding NifX family protein